MDDERRTRAHIDYFVLKEWLAKLVEMGKLTQEDAHKTERRIYQQLNIAEVEEYISSKSLISEPLNLRMRKNTEQHEKSESAGIRSSADFIFLTRIARGYNQETPGYVIQSWMRNHNTIEFLNLWEKRNNPNYNLQGYSVLLDKLKGSSFTLTPKQWIEQTGAIGLISKQGKTGGTYAHLMIACEFLTWLSPEHKMLMLELSQFRTEL